MKVRRKSLLFIFLIFFTLSLITLPSTNNNSYVERELRISGETMKIEIESEPEQLEDGDYLIGSELTFQIRKEASHSSVDIEIQGEGRFFNLTLNEGVNYWTYEWDTEEPMPNDDPIQAGEYDLNLKINGEDYNSDPDKLIFSTVEESLPMGLIIGIVIAIIISVGASAFFVIKRRNTKNDEPEISKVKKRSKKKEKIYSGASSIGRRSGELAESKSKKKSKKKHSSQKSIIKGPNVLRDVKDPFGIKRKKPSTKKRVSANLGFEMQESKSAAMMKNMELKMDLGEKTKFLISKVNSILSNIEIFKTLLEKKNQFKFICPKCNKQVSQGWENCPYCTLKKFDLELGLEQSLISLSEDLSFCTNCNRIIKPEWIKCPYCFIRNHSN